MTKLNLDQQRALLKNLSPSKKAQIKKACCACEQKGQGLGDIINVVKKIINNPLVRQIGSTVFKEFLAPWLGKKMAGNGLKITGSGRGRPRKTR